jgi:myosin-5
LGKYQEKPKQLLEFNENKQCSTLHSRPIIHTNLLLHQLATLPQACFTSNLSFVSFFFPVKPLFPWLTERIMSLNLCSVLLRGECCSFSNGEYVKAGLAELEQWCIEATDEYAGSAWDELRHIRQAVGFLVTYQKPKMSLAVITSFFPVLSIQQLYRISTNYWDEKYGTHSVSSDVIANMRVMMTEDSNNAVSSSFLLDEDDSIPFTVGDITESMEQVNVNDIELPQLIRENSSFSFLLTRKEASPS